MMMSIRKNRLHFSCNFGRAKGFYACVFFAVDPQLAHKKRTQFKEEQPPVAAATGGSFCVSHGH